jgi:hypothetical protein
MMSAANELLQAVCAALAGYAELTALIGPDGVRDRLASGKELPCVVIGETIANDYSTSTEKGEEHHVTLQVWAEAAGRRRAEEIAGMARALLDDASLPLSGYTLVNLQHVSTQARREPKTRLFYAEMRFRAVTE